MTDGPEKTASAPKNAAATVKVPALQVYVRESFFMAGEGECWLPGTGIANLSFEIDGKPVAGKKATTNNPHKIAAGLVLEVPLHAALASKTRTAARAKSTEGSEATLSLAGVADGEHVLKVIPDGKHTSNEAAGPTTESTETRLYRPLHIRLSVAKGLLTKAEELDPDDAKAKVRHGHVTRYDDDELCIDLKPDWMKTTANVRKRTQDIDLIVVHHTGGKIIGPALNEALNAKGPHYEIDPEGHVVKFVADSNVASHAGASFWGGKTGCNGFAIGIEIVHWQPDPPGSAPIPPVTDPQYASLIALLKALVKEHGIAPHRIVGHSDIRTTDDKDDPKTKLDESSLLGSDRQTCPGAMFEWTRLEAEKLGMIPKAGVEIEDDWGGYFETYDEPLRPGDSDSQRKYGGKKRKDVSGVIRAMQTDLLGIGYSVKVTGEFDEYSRQAVDRFKRHFYTGTRSGSHPKSLAVSDRIDKDTASMILAVRLGLPNAPAKAPAPGATQGMRSPPGGGAADENGDHAYALDADHRNARETAES